MNFAREKRLLLGTLAFVVVLPFPFGEPQPQGVVGFPFLALYLSAIGVFLWRATLDSQWRLPVWSMNVLGSVYLFVFLWDLRTAAMCMWMA